MTRNTLSHVTTGFMSRIKPTCAMTLRTASVIAFCAMSGFSADVAFAETREIKLAYKEAEILRKAAQTPEEMQKALEEYMPLAEQGHARAAFRIGNILYRGTLTEADTEAGIAYFRQSAEQGFDPAWRYLAFALLNAGQGEEARQAFENALAAGIDDFELQMAMAHIGQEFGTRSEPQTGVAMLKKLSDAGDERASVELAKVYADPESAFTSFKKARALVAPLIESDEADNDAIYKIAETSRKAAATRAQMATVIATYEELADLDHARSAFRLGNIFARGTLTDRDPERGIDYLRQSAELGFTSAWRYLGAELLRQDRGVEAREAFDQAINAGESGFEVILAKAHVDRKFGKASDPRIGLKLLEELAAKGDTSAQLQAAKLYADPQSGLANFEKAYDLAAPLADAGEADALWLIAGLYQAGQGVTRSYPKANELYLAAAEAGERRGIVRAGEVEIRRGLQTVALKRLSDAVSDGLPDAGPVLAEAHVRGMFGKLSDRDLGEQMIRTAVAADDLSFVLLALDMRHDDIRLGLELADLIEKAEYAAEGGHSPAAEALLRLARETTDLIENPKAKRKEYLERYGAFMRPHAYAQERAALMLDTMPRKQALAELKALLAEADFESYYNTLVGVSRSDRNAYVYLIQQELKGLGAYSGTANGMLTASTMRSMFAFCEENGYADECVHGPLRGTAVRLFSASLAMQNT